MRLCSGSTVMITAPPVPHLLDLDSRLRFILGRILLCNIRAIPALVSCLPARYRPCLFLICFWSLLSQITCLPSVPNHELWISLPVADFSCSGLFYLARLLVTLPASASDYETADPCLLSVRWIKLFYSTQLCCIWFLPQILTSTSLCAVIWSFQNCPTV